MKNQKTPFAIYLDGLPEWDKTTRLDRLFTDYLGADSTLLNHKITDLFGIAAVARAECPGIKWDSMPILVGASFVAMFQFLHCLFGEENILKMTKMMAHNGDGLEYVIDKSCVEIPAEAHGMSYHIGKGVKNFITRNSDRLRLSYDKRAEVYLRTCVYVGTAGSASHFDADFAEGRFWRFDVRVAEVDLDTLARERDQIWAEAKHLWQLAVVAAGDKCAIDLIAMAASLPRGQETASLPELTDLRTE